METLVEKITKFEIKTTYNEKQVFFENFNDEQKSLYLQFEKFLKVYDKPETLEILNETLGQTSFLLGSFPSKMDIETFNVVFPLSFSWKDPSEIFKYRNIIRWINIVQNRLLVINDEDKLKFDPDLKISSTDTIVTEPDNKEELTSNTKKKTKKKNDKKNKQTPSNDKLHVDMISFKVGHVLKVDKHPDADLLYVLSIDIGETTGPRTVCSGLVKYLSTDDIEGKNVVVITNAKPLMMRGIKSHAIVLCASDDSKVELIIPPTGSKPGDKIFFESFDSAPEKQLNPKKKIFEFFSPLFSTNEALEVYFKTENDEQKKLINESLESCKSSSIVGAVVK